MNNLMEKLAISKAIMDKHNGIKRGSNGGESINISSPELQSFETPNAKYNLPQELVSETKTINNNPQLPTKDRILNSKLPDEIKKLMIENPIAPVSPLMGGGPVLSDELIEKASKLMGTQRPVETQIESKKQTIGESSELKKMMKEVVEEVLRENGLLLESASKANENILIKVGQHVFEGKISKIKKVK
jgi:hypothetical protein